MVRMGFLKGTGIYNQALFEKIHVTVGSGTCEMSPLFTGPYSLIFGQSNEKEEPAQDQNPALVHFQWTSLLLRFRNGETAAHIFVGSGFNKNLVVDVNGLEPLTLRTSSGCSTN